MPENPYQPPKEAQTHPVVRLLVLAVFIAAGALFGAYCGELVGESVRPFLVGDHPKRPSTIIARYFIPIGEIAGGVTGCLAASRLIARRRTRTR